MNQGTLAHEEKEKRHRFGLLDWLKDAMAGKREMRKPGHEKSDHARDLTDREWSRRRARRKQAKRSRQINRRLAQ